MSAPLFRIEHLSRRFGGLKAVDDVSFEVQPGEITGLIGSNGAGKTTLVNLVTGHLKPTAGRVHFLGRDVTNSRAHRLQRLGLLRTFQVVQPFAEFTARDNVAASAFFSGKAHDLRAARSAAEQVLERLGIARLADQLPASMTLAERKRLELARAIAARPKLLFLDEVNAGLNSTEIDGVLHMLRGIADDGVAIVVIEHLMRVVRGLCRRLIVMHQGMLIADGATEIVAEDPKVMSAYLGARGAALLRGHA
jgi:branched-chain amino acid transport system ATP-binding protein